MQLLILDATIEFFCGEYPSQAFFHFFISLVYLYLEFDLLDDG